MSTKSVSTLFLFFLVITNSQALANKSDQLQVANGYVYKSENTYLLSSAPNTTAPRYDLKWKSGHAPKGLCIYGEKNGCPKYWIAFSKLEKSKEHTTFINAQVFPDPATLKSSIAFKRKMLKL